MGSRFVGGSSRAQVGHLSFSIVTGQQVLEYVESALLCGRGGRAVTPNMQMMAMAQDEPDLIELIEEHDLVLADGMPIVWASKIAGCPLPERVAGSDLIGDLLGMAHWHGHRVFLLGGEPGSCDAAMARIVREFPGATVVGHEAPQIGLSPAPGQMNELSEQLIAARPDMVFAAFGFPKQELLCLELAKACPNAWFFNIGMGLSYFGGVRARAPKLWQTLGAEWVWRLMMEPRRLAGRYLAGALPSTLRLMCWALRTRGAR